jgi:error-prone DNA polymerase
MSYYAWLCHSPFSFLQAASPAADLVEACLQNGFSGMGLCDFDGFYGIVDFWRALKRGHETLPPTLQPSQPTFESGFGVELLYTPSKLFPGKFPDGGVYSGGENSPVFLQNRLAFFATNQTSYAQLCDLVSRSKISCPLPSPEGNQKEETPPAPWQKGCQPLALSYQTPWPREGICLVPSRGQTQLFGPHHSEHFDAFLQDLSFLKKIFPDTLYLALTPPHTPGEWFAFHNHCRASQILNIPCLATPDVFYNSKTSKEIHDLLSAIRHNRPLHENHWACFAHHQGGVPERDAFVSFFRNSEFLIKSLENNEKAWRCLQFSLDSLSYQYPNHFLPAGWTSMDYLRHLVKKNLNTRYPNGTSPRIATLLDQELELIQELHFADYFLTVFDIVEYAKENKILYQGRGSAANSCVCYVLGITAVDPMVSEVLFERFISRERGEPPDIDVDFEHERREEVIQYLYQRYGRDRCAMVANVITFRTKGALRFAGKALGLEDPTISKLLQYTKTQTRQRHQIHELLQHTPESFKLSSDFLTRWGRLAQAIKGLPRHLGIHSGGFVIHQLPLTQIVPIEPASMEGRSVIQWNKQDLEDLGLFKIDVLALGMLTALRKTLHALQLHHKTIPGTHVPLSLHHIPPDCPKTFAMIQQAKTVGVFQIESRAQMAMLPRVLPQRFYDLVVEVGLVRPGPIVSGIVTKYVKRRMGIEPVAYPHPRLKPILERTLGVPVFQEQVMRIAIDVGDFSPGEADELRRAMGQWKISGRIHQFREKLFAGMQRRHIPEEFAQEICAQIEGFSEYGFPESHSTSFAILAYISSYFKAHYPAYFLVGLLNSQPLGFYSPHMLIQEARREGVEILPPCFFNSQWDSVVLPHGQVLCGFHLLPGISRSHLERFVRWRTTCSFEPSDPNVWEKVLEGMNLLAIHERISLIMAGTLRSLQAHRPSLLWTFLARPAPLLDIVEMRTFPVLSELQEEWDNACDDFKFSQTTLGRHPVELIKTLFWPFSLPISKLTDSRQLGEKKSGATVFVYGLLIVRQFPPTAKGMCFVTLEDASGTVQIAIPPPLVEKELSKIMGTSFFCIKGICQKLGKDSSSVLAQAILPFVQNTPISALPVERGAQSVLYG